MISEAYHDFGFSILSEDELKQTELKAKEEAKQAKKKLAALEQQDGPNRQKLEQMHRMIMPLLFNLKQNPESEIIKWPNREEKINEFIAKLDALVK